MIAALNKATRAAIPVARVSKADKKVKQEQAAEIQETRNSRAEQVGAVNKASRGSKVRVNKEEWAIVIASGVVSKKKLLQIGIIHLMMMTRTQNNQDKDLQTGTRIQTPA
jgi:hypothetical protein